jgi:hypothetical protein
MVVEQFVIAAAVKKSGVPKLSHDEIHQNSAIQSYRQSGHEAYRLGEKAQLKIHIAYESTISHDWLSFGL